MIVRLSVAGATQELLAGVAQALARHNARIFRLARAAGPVRPPHVRGRYRVDQPAESLELVDAAALDEHPVGSCGSWSACMAGWLISLGSRAQVMVERTGDDVWHATVLTGGHQWDPAQELPWTS